MAGETGPTAEIAEKISKELMKRFRWSRLPPKDRNFDCVKQQKHARANKKQKHTHPTDVVFKYIDPYLNRTILLNTDLKSYAKSSMGAPNVRAALKSLAQTIDCARVSPEWRERYDIEEEGTSEIRGLLFVYNHDAEFDGTFERFLTPAKDDDQDQVTGGNINNLPLEAGQLLHLLEPKTIAYLQTIVKDTERLHFEGTFPVKDYFFYYPDQKLHRAHLERFHRPATVELMCGPYMIIGHDAVAKYDEDVRSLKQTFGEGYVIYYNRAGATHYEFMYLFDILSNYQLLNGDNQIRIRVAHHSPHQQIKSNYLRAIDAYVKDWGNDEYQKSKLEMIDFQVLDITKQSFSKTNVGWDE